MLRYKYEGGRGRVDRLRRRATALISLAHGHRRYRGVFADGFGLGIIGIALTLAGPELGLSAMWIGLTPLWLVNRGLSERAERVVRLTMGSGVRAPNAASAMAAPGSGWKELFSARWRARTFVGCIFFACQVVPYFAVGTFVTQVLTALHMSGKSTGGLVYNLALFAGAVGGLLIVDKISRRTFLVGSFVSTGAAMLALSTWSSVPPTVTIVLFAIFAGILSAASNLVYVYLPELFPTRLRASGIGVAIATSRVASAAGTFLLPVVVSVYGVHLALGACVAVLALGAWFCYRWAPETKDLSLELLDRAPSAAVPS